MNYILTILKQLTVIIHLSVILMVTPMGALASENTASDQYTGKTHKQKNQSDTAEPRNEEDQHLKHAQAKSSEHVTNSDAIYIKDSATNVTEDSFLTGQINIKVFLSVGRLKLQNGRIKGEYRVKVNMDDVPLPFRMFARSKNEKGNINLKTDVTMHEMIEEGAALKGKGYSPEKKEYRDIFCKLTPASKKDQKGDIELTIDSGKRVMKFNSKYAVVDKKVNKQEAYVANFDPSSAEKASDEQDEKYSP